MKIQELKIEGMTCGHCIMHVKEELSKLPHVRVNDVRIGEARVTYDEGNVTQSDFERAVDAAGYKLVRMR